MGENPRRRLWAALFGAVAAVHLATLYWPRTPQVTAPRLTDKVIHAVVFGAPVIVGARAGLPLRWLVVTFAVHAPVSELIQHTVLPKRSGEVWDAVLDLAGVAAAAGIATALERRRAGASLAEAPPRTG